MNGFWEFGLPTLAAALFANLFLWPWVFTTHEVPGIPEYFDAPVDARQEVEAETQELAA